jgi:hypothetical protein
MRAPIVPKPMIPRSLQVRSKDQAKAVLRAVLKQAKFPDVIQTLIELCEERALTELDKEIETRWMTRKEALETHVLHAGLSPLAISENHRKRPKTVEVGDAKRTDSTQGVASASSDQTRRSEVSVRDSEGSVRVGYGIRPRPALRIYTT